MADISLTASMRSNLLSLQNTQSLMDMTQERLSTGKKVNSAIDNPSSYYASQALTNRANDLNALLDNMGQAIQTIKAANEGIESITSFAQQAKAISNSARDIPSNFNKYALTSVDVGTAGLEDSDTLVIDSRKDLSTFNMTFGASENGHAFDVYIDGKAHKITLADDATTAPKAAKDVTAKLQALGLVIEPGEGEGDIVVSSRNGSDIYWLNTDVASADTAAKSITLASGDIKNSATLSAKLVDSLGGIVSVDVMGDQVSLMSKDKEFFVTGTAAPKLGIEKKMPAGDALAPVIERRNYSEQFNKILEQIDNIVQDAGYKGINLLQNNNLRVIFNEYRTSELNVKGRDVSSAGLKLSAAIGDWQRNEDLEISSLQIENAINELRALASEFGTNYSIIQGREDFTSSIINVLEEGSDKLILADMNEESANMLALQTRQQLAINSLSLASQAAQAVLKLF